MEFYGRPLLTFIPTFLYFILVTIEGNKRDDLTSYVLTENEYKYNMGQGYVFFEVIEPEELSYTYKLNPAAFSVPWNKTYGITNLVLGYPPCGCGSLHNSEDVEGQIVLLERGECSFTSKALKAQEAGAAAAIITEQNPDNDDLYISMVDDTTGRDVIIPTAFLLGKNGHMIRHTLQKHGLKQTKIRIPLNISSIPIHQLNQPPWLVW